MATSLSTGAVRTGDHIAQLYRNDLDLVTTIGSYLAAAVVAGETVVAIAKSEHRRAFENQISAVGIDLTAARSNGQCLLFDACDVMPLFIKGGHVDRDGFHSVIGEHIRTAIGRGRLVRVYGEMVTVLWEAGELLAAIDLEAMWNDLGDSFPFSLICAYPADIPPGLGCEDELQRVCGLHSLVLDPATDDREIDLSDRIEVCARFSATREAPRTARHFVVDVLGQLGYDDDLVDDAALISTELATNAVVHARSPFSVMITTKGPIVRIAVTDADELTSRAVNGGLHPKPGHGLGLIAGLASNWGVELGNEVKIVWAELNVLDAELSTS